MKWTVNFLVFFMTFAPNAWAIDETRSVTKKNTAEETLDVTRLTRPPTVLRAANPSYPQTMLGSGEDAEVTLLVDISDRGEVTGAAVMNAEPVVDDSFRQAALEAAYSLEFSPAEIDDQPIAVQVYYTFKFKAPKPIVGTESTSGDGGVVTVTNPTLAASDAGIPMGPTAPIRGRILERGTRVPMQGISVVLYRETVGDAGVGAGDLREVETNLEGFFEIVDLTPGRWTLVIESPGYRPYKTDELVQVNEQLTVTYYIERLSNNPYDVVVSAVRPQKEVSRTVLNRATIDKIPGAGGDPLTVVQNLAGVARVTLGQGDLIVRGSAPRDTRVYIGGVDVPTVYHFGGLRSVLPLPVVESIDFVPGNFSAYYGRGTGGIVDVSLARRDPKRIGGTVDVNVLDAGFFIEMPVGKHAAIGLAARRSYIDTLLKAFYPSDAEVGFQTAPRYYDYQLLGQYRPSRRHDVRFMFFGSDDQLKLLFKDPAAFDPQVGGNQFGISTTFYRSLLSYSYTRNENLTNVLRLSQGRNWLAFGIGVLSFDISVYSSQVRDTFRYRWGEHVALSVGMDFLFQRGSGSIALPPRQKEGQAPSNTDYQAIQRTTFNRLDWWSPAGFVELELRPFKGLLAVPGFRVDYFGRVNETTFEPRLALRQTVSSFSILKAGVGLYHQEPDFGEDYPKFGNPNLTTESAWHFSAGSELRIQRALSLDATFFYKAMSHLVSPTEATVVENGSVQPLIYDNGGKGRVLGMELLLRHDGGDRLSGWIAYTLSRAKRRDSGAQRDRLFDFDQTHILTAVGNVRLGERWTVGARFRFVSGNPRTPITASVMNASVDRYEPIFGQVNSVRNDSFHQLDLRVDRSWLFNRYILHAYLDVQNVYNRSNAEGLVYSYDYSQSSPQRGLPILAIFGVKADL
jgi:TonB family protein